MSKYYIPFIRAEVKMNDSELSVWNHLSQELDDSIVSSPSIRESIIEYVKKKVEERNAQNPRCNKMIVRLNGCAESDSYINVCRTSKAKGCVNGVSISLFSIKILAVRKEISKPMIKEKGADK